VAALGTSTPPLLHHCHRSWTFVEPKASKSCVKLANIVGQLHTSCLRFTCNLVQFNANLASTGDLLCNLMQINANLLSSGGISMQPLKTSDESISVNPKESRKHCCNGIA
jgi:hypothetical protein